MKSLTIRHLKDLRAPHWSAASGLVVTDKYLFSIADDELHLLIHPRQGVDGLGTGRLLRLFPGKLPDPKKARKKVKPDLESLTFWPRGRNFKFDQLLAVPSGSRPNRDIGARIRLRANGSESSARPVSFAVFYDHLRERFSELNIEGVVIRKSELRFYQRGNGSQAQNAVITYSRSIFEKQIPTGHVGAEGILKIQKIRLPKIQGHTLSFTDATMWNNEHDVFLAAAEGGDDTYLDGEFLGARLGWIDLKSGACQLLNLPIQHKPEGLAKVGNQVWIVTDADDRRIAASLIEVKIKG